MPHHSTSLSSSLALVVAALALTACSSRTVATPVGSSEVSPTGSSPASATSAAPLPPSASSPGLESAPPLGQPACAASTLSVVDADAVTVGSSLEEVFVVRTSGPDCQLSGYPKLAFTGADGKPLPVTVGQGGQGLPASTPGPVTLSRTTSVSFGVATARTGTCLAASAVRVTLPATTPTFAVTTSMQICGGAVGLTPVQRRADADGG